MGLLDRFKKKEDNFDNLPFLPNEPSLPPLPPQKGMQMGRGMPPMRRMPQKMSGPGDLPELPPIPKIPREYSRDLPSIPKLPKPRDFGNELPPLSEPDFGDEKLPDIKEDDLNIPELSQPKPMPQFNPSPSFSPEPEMEMAPRKTAKVFVQLSKYKDIVNTVGKMESRINELQNAINKLRDIRAKESQLIEGWDGLLGEAKSKMEDVNRKLPHVDEY